MNKAKNNLFLCLLLLLIVGLACKFFSSSSNTNSNQNTNSNPGNLNATSGQNNKPARDPNEKIFRGAIYVDAGASSFVMKLKKENNQLNGSYYYLKSRKDISLKGTIDKQNKFKLEETSQGKVTGTFTGDWKDTEGDPAVRLEGQWKKPESEEEWSFYASEQTIETTGEQKIEDKSIKDEDKKKKLSVSIFYPQISGFGPQTDAINKDIASAFNKDIAQFKKETDCTESISGDLGCYFEVSYNTDMATDDLLSFSFEANTYSGGAHPNSFTTTLTYDVKSGKTLGLGDLFKPNSNYVKTISDYCIEALKKQMRVPEQGIEPDEEMIRDGAGPKEENFNSWSVSKKGVVVYFAPYQVGPYAAGPQVVVIPYKVLKDKAKEDGALSPYVK